MSEFKAPSGAKVVISQAPFEDVLNLKDAIVSNIGTASFSIKFDPKMDEKDNKKEDILEKDIDVADFVKIAALVDSDRQVRDLIFVCLARCLHNNQKITLATFEKPEYRQDYYPVILECVKENLSPFLEALVSLLSPMVAAGMSMLEQNQKSLKQK